jgi:hypothetical protein
MNRIKHNLICLFILLICFSLIPLFNGPLFAFSPIKYGYASYRYSNYNVFIDRKIYETILPDEWKYIFDKEEQFHNINYITKFSIYICYDNKESKRIFPYFTTSSSGFGSSGKFIFINYKNMIKLGYSIQGIIAHEASHILLEQNTRRFDQRTYNFSKYNDWFTEGIAVYFQGYEPYSIVKIKHEQVNQIIIYDTNRNNFYVLPRNQKIDYELYGKFIDYIIVKYGKDALQRYIKEFVKDISSGGKYFELIYHKTQLETLSEYLQFSGLNQMQIITQ